MTDEELDKNISALEEERQKLLITVTDENQTEVSLLKQLALKLRNENITVMAYVADGDSGYKSLVNSTIQRLNSERLFISFD